jgi:hypothetical protein
MLLENSTEESEVKDLSQERILTSTLGKGKGEAKLH